MPFHVKVGEAIKFGHYSCIVINQHTTIGNNVTIANGVTIGNNLTKGVGSPKIGDNCILAPGCKILGPIELGENCFVGVNAVVTKSFPKNSVLGGVNKLISTNGEEIIIKCINF